MEILLSESEDEVTTTSNKPFWVVWAIELWERFGYYGVQAIIALYFVRVLGYSEAESFYVFGSFSALCYGFVWVGGWLGDKYLGAKRTMILGAAILMISYAALAMSTHATVFYALSGIIVGSCLFKANPSSLISKLYAKGDPALDGAMTLYYMAINIGAMVSMSITPVIAKYYSWSAAYWICALGLLLGIGNYFVYNKAMAAIGTEAGKLKLNYKRMLLTIVVSLIAALIIAQILDHTTVCNWIVYTVVAATFIYFLKITISLKGVERTRMFVAFILILEGVIFFVLYNQMPTSLTFFAVHNINNHIFGWTIPAAEYQVLNSLVIIVMSPILSWLYCKFPATHVTKFCFGMTLCALAFLVLSIPQYTATNGLASPGWMVLTYFLQSTGELLISGLGLAMIAELCPRNMSGFMMGIWLITSMLAGPIGAWVGALTVPTGISHTISATASMHIYASVFQKIGIWTGVIALLMWLSRTKLNRLLKAAHEQQG